MFKITIFALSAFMLTNNFIQPSESARKPLSKKEFLELIQNGLCTPKTKFQALRIPYMLDLEVSREGNILYHAELNICTPADTPNLSLFGVEVIPGIEANEVSRTIIQTLGAKQRGIEEIATIIHALKTGTVTINDNGSITVSNSSGSLATYPRAS